MKRFILIGLAAVALASGPAWAGLREGLEAIDRSDYGTALKELRPLAEGGNAEAQYGLGRMYSYGWGVRKDEAEAVKWWRKAAEQGHAGAQRVLGFMYEKGLGVEKNQAEADRWKRSAAAPGSGPAPGTAAATNAPGAASEGAAPLPRAGRGLSREAARQLEEKLKTNPDDLPTRTLLLGYYFSSAIRDMGQSATIDARRRHVLWIIQNHPEAEVAGSSEATLDPSGHPLADHDGYARAKALWLKQVDNQKDKTRILFNAAMFFKLHDKELAASLLKKGQAAEPNNPQWSSSLGYVYALGMLGINGLNQNGLPTSVDPSQAEGAFAKKAMTEAKASTSAALAGTAGKILMQYGPWVRASGKSGPDRGELAIALLEKAQSLEPDNPFWSANLGQLYDLARIGAKSPEARADYAKKALVEIEKSLGITVGDKNRMYRLEEAAKVAFEAGETKRAEKYASELLEIGSRHKGDEAYGPAVHDGNMVLGRLALKGGDTLKAKEYLLSAGRTLGGGALTSFGPNMSLAKDLLDKGERETVISYLESCRKFWSYPKNPLDAWIGTIKAGGVPEFGANLNY